MISQLKNYNFPISNRTNFKSEKTLLLNHNNTLNFSGNNYVQENLLGEKIFIPKAVHDARSSSKRIKSFVYGLSGGSETNAVFLENNLFLSVAHGIEKGIHDGLGIGKHFPFQDYFIYGIKRRNPSDEGALVKISPELDLSLIKADPIEEYFESPKSKKIIKKPIYESSKSKPVKIASSMPEIGETVYIIGSNGYWEGQKAVPAVITENLETTETAIGIGDNATHYTIFSKILDKNKGHFSAHGLSGSPVVNKNGELVGILDRKAGNEDNLLIVDINTINKFLKEYEEGVEVKHSPAKEGIPWW